MRHSEPSLQAIFLADKFCEKNKSLFDQVEQKWCVCMILSAGKSEDMPRLTKPKWSQLLFAKDYPGAREPEK